MSVTDTTSKSKMKVEICIPVKEAFLDNASGINFSLWSTLHQYAKNYPFDPTPQDKSDAIKFYESFGKAIPCLDPCRIHYEKWFHKYPLENALISREELQKYVIDLHNDVNRRTQKRILSYEEALSIQAFNSQCNWTRISHFLQNDSFHDESSPTQEMFGGEQKKIIGLVAFLLLLVLIGLIISFRSSVSRNSLVKRKQRIKNEPICSDTPGGFASI